MSHWFEVNRRMLDYLQTALRVPLVEPVLKRGPVPSLGRIFKPAAERVERKLAHAIRLATEQRHDAGCRASGQSMHPFINKWICHSPLVALRPTRSRARKERNGLG